MSQLKLLWGLFFSLFIYGSSFAQVLDDFDESPVAKVEQAREQFITKYLQLNDEEATSFWRTYYDYQDEQRAIKSNYRPAKSLDRMSDREADQFILSRLEMEDKLLNLKRDYFKRFKQIIGAKRVALFTKAEKEFRKEVIRRFKENRRRRGRFNNRN